jgi:predicted N-formylglutamate amidohydrolase
VDSKGLCSAVLGLIKEHGHVERIRESLIDISADGIIDESETTQFEAILNELLDLEEQIERIKLHAARVLPLPQIMQKRKETALAAR